MLADFYFNPLGDLIICRILEELSNNNITYHYNQYEKELFLIFQGDKTRAIEVIGDILKD